MNYNIVAIPTLGESPLLAPLVWQLAQTTSRYDLTHEIIVIDNREDQSFPLSGDPLLDLAAKIWHMPGERFYRMWNHAWAHAKVRATARPDYDVNFILLNDDIRITPDHFIERLVEPLRTQDIWCTYPNWQRTLDRDDPTNFTVTPTQGTYKDGGLWGCAFALRAELLNNPLPPIDERFDIWCGDDDLVKQLELAGHPACRIDGLALEHEASTTVNQHPEVRANFDSDVAKFRAKYGSW
jgi:hypothetical protein